MTGEESVNPYQARNGASAAELRNQTPGSVRRSLRTPATVLCVLALGTVLLELFSIYTVVIDTIRFIEHFGIIKGSLRAAPFTLGFGLIFFSHLFVFVTAVRASFMTGYRMAIGAAVVSIIPVLSPGYLIGIPFGVWLLVVLRRNSVREAFDR